MSTVLLSLYFPFNRTLGYFLRHLTPKKLRDIEKCYVLEKHLAKTL